MNKEDIKLIIEIEQRCKSNTKRLDEHDKKIDELSNVYIALTKVNDKVEVIDSDVKGIQSDIENINGKLDEKTKEKGMKWDKLIDYLFYLVIAYFLAKLGLK